jgi:hypothetical protein
VKELDFAGFWGEKKNNDLVHPDAILRFLHVHGPCWINGGSAASEKESMVGQWNFQVAHNRPNMGD